jgi:hypothetical protein
VPERDDLVSRVNQRWARPSTSYLDHGVCSSAYCDQREAATRRVMALYSAGLPLDFVVTEARQAYRTAWEAEKARARGDG